MPHISIYQLAEQCLFDADVNHKLAVTAEAWRLHEAGELDLDPATAPPARAIQDTALPERPERVDPRQVPQRKLSTLAGRIALLHAVAHIEFTAIHLAWDILYRFRHLPAAFRRDWLRVAEEEGQHFGLIRGRLHELGSDYGELPAHAGLWQLAVDSADDVLLRLALVPRCMEARGLDVTPGIIERLAKVGDAASVAHLNIILRDEIGHVALGSQWLAWECQRRGVPMEATYFDLLAQHFPAGLRGPFNLDARRQAGFSAPELLRLQQTSGAPFSA